MKEGDTMEPANGEMEDIFKIDSREKLIGFLADQLDSLTGDTWPYVDLTDQTVGLHFDSGHSEFDEDEMLDGHEIVDIERVSPREGFTVMERFAQSRQGKERDKLLRVLSRRHPFRAFRSEAQYLGILQEWYDFKNKAYEEFAEERLDDADVDFVDGRIVCTNPKNIQVVVAEKDDDEDEDEDEDE